MLKRLPDEFTVDRIKSSFKINKIYLQWQIKFYTVMYDTMQRVKMIYTGAVSSEPTLIFSQQIFFPQLINLFSKIIRSSFDTVDRSVIPLLLLQKVVSPYLGMMVMIPFLQSLGMSSSSKITAKRSLSHGKTPRAPYFNCSLAISSTPTLLQFFSFLIDS